MDIFNISANADMVRLIGRINDVTFQCEINFMDTTENGEPKVSISDYRLFDLPIEDYHGIIPEDPQSEVLKNIAVKAVDKAVEAVNIFCKKCNYSLWSY